MVGWHHQLNGHEFEQTPGDSEGEGGLVCCSPLVAKSQTRLSNFTFTLYFHALEKEMAAHSSVLAWRIPGLGEPGGLPSMGVAQSWTQLKQLSSSSNSIGICRWPTYFQVLGEALSIISSSAAAAVMSNSQRPHGLQPTRLLHPWDFPGKSTGVGCHLQF